MKKVLFIFLSVAIISISCTKTDNLTVTLKQSANLSATITDNTGKGIANTNVKLYDELGQGILTQLKTDVNGNVNFGEVNDGSYNLEVDSPKINNIKYNPSKLIQVISASPKNVVINVQDYVGTYNLTFTNTANNPGTVYANLNAILVPVEIYNYNDLLAIQKSKAEFSGKADADGKLSFTIPSDRYFELVVFENGNTNYSDLYEMSLSKGEIQNSFFDVNLSNFKK